MAETVTEVRVRKPREFVAIVTSDKMMKTRVVMVSRRVKDTTFAKYVTKRVKYKAHDEKNESHTGDRVLIVETRPMSADKRWRIVKLIEKAPEA